MHAKDFDVHEINGYIESIYLLEFPDKILLLDGAARPDIEIIEDFITKTMNRPMSDLKLIVSTHMHPDHAGAAPFLHQKYNIPIASYFEADLWYKGFGGFLQQKLDIFLASYVVRKKKTLKKKFAFPRKLNADYLLKENDVLPFFEDWKIIHAPGHTSHMMVLYNQSEKILYAADVLLRLNGKCQLPFPVELKKYGKQTLLKLADLDVDTMLLAHGGICENLDTKQIFLNLIPKLSQKFKFPMTIMELFVGFNPALRKYFKNERYME